MTKLSEIMTSPVFTAPPETSVAEASEAMVRRGFGSVIIVEGLLPAGILTERDILRAAASGADLTSSPVSRWMTRDPETAESVLDVDQAAETMLAGGFRHMPVTAGNDLVGIVSLRDLLSTHIHRHPV